MINAPMSRSKRRRARRPRRGLGALVAGLLVLALCGAALFYIIGFPSAIEQQIYPLAYEDLIEKYAGEYDLDPARVAAVIYCESSFRPQVTSSADARGLMQIIPSTGAWIATKVNDEAYTDEKLYDPETNIRYGCWYLSYLDRRFGGDLATATAAYHAGEGTVGGWLDDQALSKNGETLSDIPSSVTGNYVGKVAEVYEKYKEIMKA